jgi:magnesium transporter
MTASTSIINCAGYKNGKRLNPIALESIAQALQDTETFIWVGLLEPDQDMLKKLQELFSLHELAIEDASKAHQRPKLEEYGDTLFIVLHTAALMEGEGQAIAFGETHVFMGPRFLITVRHGNAMGYTKVRERAETNPERLARGPGFALYAIVDFIVDQYQVCMDGLQTRFRCLEQQLFDPNPQNDHLQDFYNLKNELLTLQAAAAPLAEVCTQLVRFHTGIVPKESHVYYRDVLDHVARVTQAADRMREMINAAMQVALAQVTIRQNEVVKRLAGWGALLAVPTVVFSLYGMNFDYMPELQWRGSYPAVLCGVLAVCFLLYRRLKRARWL